MIQRQRDIDIEIQIEKQRQRHRDRKTDTQKKNFEAKNIKYFYIILQLTFLNSMSIFLNKVIWEPTTIFIKIMFT